jgi:hypothetical protein
MAGTRAGLKNATLWDTVNSSRFADSDLTATPMARRASNCAGVYLVEPTTMCSSPLIML